MMSALYRRVFRKLSLLLLIAATLQISGPILRSVAAQTYVLDVLIEEDYAETGAEFLQHVERALDPEARDGVRFVSRFAARQEIDRLLEDSSWTVAIVSSETTEIDAGSAAFKLPFVFSGLKDVMDLQRSPAGQQGLAGAQGEGRSGLVYLNAGLTHVAGLAAPTTPGDLQGQKVAVQAVTDVTTIQQLGASTVTVPQNEVQASLSRGAVDSVLISSGDTESWIIPEGGYFLQNGLNTKVAIVLTNDETWDQLPFIVRAMIGDAAIAASAELDQALLKTEEALQARANGMGATFVQFDEAEVAKAAEAWIASQPEAQQSDYSEAFELFQVNRQSVPAHPVAPERRSQLEEVLFATTRADHGRSARFKYRFGDGRTGLIKCGRAKRSTPSSVTEPAGDVLSGTTPCMEFLASELADTDRVLIVVHGFGNRFTDALDRALLLKELLGEKTSVLLWSWPSRRDGLETDYDYDKESVSGIAQHRFRELLLSLGQQAGSPPLHLLAHSMGGWHTLGAIQAMPELQSPILASLIMAAPDIPSDEFGLGLEALYSSAARVILYACEWDWALRASSVMNEYRRAGEGGHANILVDAELESVDVDARWAAINHSYVFESPTVAKDVSAIVVGGYDAQERGLKPQPKGTLEYWRYP